MPAQRRRYFVDRVFFVSAAVGRSEQPRRADLVVDDQLVRGRAESRVLGVFAQIEATVCCLQEAMGVTRQLVDLRVAIWKQDAQVSRRSR